MEWHDILKYEATATETKEFRGLELKLCNYLLNRGILEVLITQYKIFI